MWRKEMNNKLRVNTKFSMLDYLAIVDAIADEFFDSDGTYQPQIGKINAMRLFYNHCVLHSKFDDKYGHDVEDADDLAEIIADKEFVKMYNRSIHVGSSATLDFRNAYNDAMEIVKHRKSSFGNLSHVLSSALNQLSSNFSNILTDENIEKVSQIAKNMSDEKFNVKSFVEAYAGYLENQESNQ